MKNIIYSEMIKLKKSGSHSLIFLIPLVTIFMAILVGGTQIFATFSIYWWEACFLFLLIGLLFVYDEKAEERAGKFQNINHKQMSWKISLAKIFLIFIRLLIATIFFIFLLYISTLIYKGIIVIDFLKTSSTLFLMLLAITWNIPVLYLLSKRMNVYVLLSVNTLICLLIAPILAQTSIWFLFPYTYHYKISSVLLHIKPAGDLIENYMNLSVVDIVVPFALSIFLTILFLYLLKSLVSYDKK